MRGRAIATAIARVDPRISLEQAMQCPLDEMAGTSPAMTMERPSPTNEQS
jgi:hypothetical protein